MPGFSTGMMSLPAGFLLDSIHQTLRKLPRIRILPFSIYTYCSMDEAYHLLHPSQNPPNRRLTYFPFQSHYLMRSQTVAIRPGTIGSIRTPGN
jgi:hypothetical protein